MTRIDSLTYLNLEEHYASSHANMVSKIKLLIGGLIPEHVEVKQFSEGAWNIGSIVSNRL